MSGGPKNSSYAPGTMSLKVGLALTDSQEGTPPSVRRLDVVKMSAETISSMGLNPNEPCREMNMEQ